MFIDPPSPFAPTKEWREFLDEMRAIPRPNADVKKHIALAEEEMKRRQNLSE